jgi:hypothetical protein
MIPDRLPEALRDPIRQFPPGSLQFEVGVQTFNNDVAELISRRQDNAKLEENVRFLRSQTGVHVHADLIVGLPGEDVESFGRGFDRLVAMNPQEIQVGMLKRLRGTPIVRHDKEWGMVYSPHAPYEIMQTKLIDFPTMRRLRRFARFWDIIANSGNFVETTPLIWGVDSPFEQFLGFSNWLYEKAGRTHAVSLPNLIEHLMTFLIEQRGVDEQKAAQSLWRDYQRGGRSDRPAALKKFVEPANTRKQARISAPPRQARHSGVT